MARLLRVHFASIGHADARLDRLTLDLRSRAASGTGADTILWLRNGGGKSTILNLFYSLFRPDRRDFLGASAEGRARHLEDYVKADDLAFVVTEWDVDPIVDEVLFARPPARRRIVGQVLSWRDHQRHNDHTRLRRRFFTMLVDGDVDLDRLPIAGLGPEPVRSYDAFRDWLDDLRHRRPEVETYHEDTPRKWTECLERIGLDPELFRYQLRMNAREGSADEAFRFRTTEEFIKFFLEIALDTGEADQVSANVQGFRDKLARRPDLQREQTFLIDARHRLGPLREAVAAVRSADRLHSEDRAAAAAVARAVEIRGRSERAAAQDAMELGVRGRKIAMDSANERDRLGRWANGLERRALELDVSEAKVARAVAAHELCLAREQVAVARGAIARDQRRAVEAERDAKARALAAAQAAEEPVRREVARAGATLRGRLDDAAAIRSADIVGLVSRQVAVRTDRDACDQQRDALNKEDSAREQEILGLNNWLNDRERQRERLRDDGQIALREEAVDAVARWRSEATRRTEDATQFETQRGEAKLRARVDSDAAAELSSDVARMAVEIVTARRAIADGLRELARLQRAELLQDVESTDEPNLDAPGLVDRLRTEADRAHRAVLVASVDGAEDDRALGALQATGRLPPAPDVERALTVLRGGGVTAWSGTEYLAENLAEAADRERLVRADPAAWHGLVVHDGVALEKARQLLQTFTPRMAVTVCAASLEASPDRPDRVVLPGSSAHWDRRAGTALHDQLDERRRGRDRDARAQSERQRAATKAADDVERWRAVWGDGRLAVSRSDLDQLQALQAQREAARDAANVQASLAREEETHAEAARRKAEADATRAQASAARVAAFVDRFDVHAEARRDERAAAEARRVEIATEIPAVAARRAAFEASFLRLRDEASAADFDLRGLQAERDAVYLYDADPPGDGDLVGAREEWSVQRGRWEGVVSGDRLQWELDQLEDRLRAALTNERALCRDRATVVAEVPEQGGEAALRAAVPAESAALEAEIAAGIREFHAEDAFKREGTRRRDADDLPSNEEAPLSAEAARERARRCRTDRDGANERASAENAAAGEHEARQAAATAEANQCEQRGKRLREAIGPVDAGVVAELPIGSASVEDLVDARVASVRASEKSLGAARRTADDCGEALRDVALAAVHEPHRSQVKERLKAPPAELATAADALQVDVEERLAVVRADLDEIDEDRGLVLQELDKVAMDGVRLLQGADRASRLPSGLDAWDGESFLRIRLDVPNTQAERKARLEPLLDRLVDKAIIPDGRTLANEAVLVLGDRRIEATLLKPDAVLRRDRYPVMDMQAFSGGQKLTVQVLLYCTLARMRARQRGRAGTADAGVLLLDNPVGTASSVALLELQRKVARQMRVQLVYTTGVNDANAIATFPNAVRLRNAHMSKKSGDLHVTVDDGVDAIRVVATT